jgi:hypothetical protein
MATAIAPPHTFSTSTSSSFRASQCGAPPLLSPSYSDNPLTQLPRVDFNFEDLRQRMSAFTVKFDAFIEKGRKRVLEERNEFRGRLGELNGTWLEEMNHTRLMFANLGLGSLREFVGPMRSARLAIHLHIFVMITLELQD